MMRMVGVILDHLHLIFVASAVVKYLSLSLSQVKGDESNELDTSGTENSQVKC